MFLKTKQKPKKPKPAFESLGALHSIAMEISVSCNLMFGFFAGLFFFFPAIWLFLFKSSETYTCDRCKEDLPFPQRTIVVLLFYCFAFS